MQRPQFSDVFRDAVDMRCDRMGLGQDRFQGGIQPIRGDSGDFPLFPAGSKKQLPALNQKNSPVY
jgi:hypothetical protein